MWELYAYMPTEVPFPWTTVEMPSVSDTIKDREWIATEVPAPSTAESVGMLEVLQDQEWTGVPNEPTLTWKHEQMPKEIPQQSVRSWT